MAQILALVVRISAWVQQILGIVTGIQDAQAAQATEALANLIYGDTEAIVTTVNNATWGNFALYGIVSDILTTMVARFDSVDSQLAALSGTLAGGVTVTSLDPGIITDIGNEVWEYPIPTTGTLAYVHLQDAGTYATQKSNFQEVIDSPRGASWWRLLGSYNVDGQADISPSVTFDLDLSTILPTDATAADWVQRVYTSAPWTVFDNGMAGIPDPGVNSYFWIVWITPDVWAILQNALFGAGSALNLAPVWPGLSGVTLGTPIDITLTFTIDGPLAGVIVALTAYPTLKGHYDYDDYVQALKIGALTFVSDNGDAEYVQALGFMNEVYVPKNMTQAASCKFRTVAGVTGTVTPFTIP